MELMDLAQKIALFLIQLFICELGYLISLPRRKHFPLRFLVSLALFLGMVVLNACLRAVLPGDGIYMISQLKGILYFVILIFCNALMVHWSFDVRYMGALFVVVGGYSIEHVASRFSYALKTISFKGGEVPLATEVLLFVLLVPILYSSLAYFLLIRKGIAANKVRFYDKKILVVSGINLFICIALSAFEPEPPVGTVSVEEIFVVCASYVNTMLGCVLCLCLQVGLFRESELDEKNRMLTEMLQLERENQNVSKETIEIINRKCHDLRHQISMLEIQTPEDRAKSLKNLSDAILIYDSIAKTGNRSVDLVLMEKKLFCEKYNIQFNYMVDGEKFGFMDEADIYAMLGNMLENAIESVSKEEDPEARIITFIARTRGSMLYISLENYCSAKLEFKDGLPETVKLDKAFHGFGTKSIVHIAESYGGKARFLVENNYFIVEVLLPIPGKGD